MGDTHVDKIYKEERTTSLEKFTNLLEKVTTYENILCIIHGGDGTHNGNQEGLTKFVNKAKEVLYLNNTKKDYIPFFMNIGNHEYSNSTASEIHYINLVGKTNQIINLKPQQLDIILLNTGCKSDGFFNKHNYFKKELNKIGEYINKVDSQIKFLVDMHIPPSIRSLEDKSEHNKTPHSLNCVSTNNFKEFIDKYSDRIITIVTHHLHCFYQKNPCISSILYENTPFYLTANAGHCISDCGSEVSPIEFLKFDFELKGDVMKAKELKIINVNRIY